MDNILYNYFIAFKINEIAKQFFLKLLLQDKTVLHQQVNSDYKILYKFQIWFLISEDRILSLLHYLIIYSYYLGSFKVKVKEIKVTLVNTDDEIFQVYTVE